SDFNVNKPGCTYCFALTDCNVECLAPPTCVCTDLACCAEVSPCCDGCPDPKPLRCETGTCTCTPDTCCSTVCPTTPAPTASKTAMAFLVAVLVALGVGTVRLRP